MPNCNCTAAVCGCVIEAGDGVTVTGAGSRRSPFVISAEGGGGGGGDGIPAGVLLPYGGGSAPTGYLLAQGQAVSRSAYADLFAAIGTTYGPGNGTTTFNVPDSRGRFILGAAPTYPVGSTGGAATTTLTQANLPPHVHTMGHTHSIAHDHGQVNTGPDGGHTHGATVRSGNNEGTASTAVLRASATGAAFTDDPVAVAAVANHVHAVNLPPYVGNSGAASTPNTGNVGSGQAFSNLPPYVAATFIIKT